MRSKHPPEEADYYREVAHRFPPAEAPEPAWSVVTRWLLWGFAIWLAVMFYGGILFWLLERMPT